MNIVNKIKTDDSAFWDTCRLAISGSVEKLREKLSEYPQHLHQKTIGIKDGMYQVSLLHLVGSADKARLLVELGLDLHVMDDQNNTPLHFAALAGRKEVVTELLSLGANREAKNRWDQTPLQLAITPELAYLLSDDPQPLNFESSLHNLSIYIAAEKGKIEVIRYLLQASVDPNLLNHEEYMLDDHYKTPLRHSVYIGYVEIARLLLEHGANPNIHPNLYREVYNVGTARLLHSYGTKATPENLDAAIWEAVVNVGNSNLVQEYIEYGAPLDKKYLLHDAIKRPDQTNQNHLKIVEMLVQKKPEFLHYIHHNESPLQKAIDIRNQPIVDLLIQLGADVNQKNSDGHTPLHIAVLNNNKVLLEVLLKNGADPTLEDQFGLTPYQYAVMRLRTQICEVFESYYKEQKQDTPTFLQPLTVEEGKQSIFDQQNDLVNLYHVDDINSWVFFRFRLKDFVAFAKKFGFSPIFQTSYYMDQDQVKHFSFDDQGLLEKDLSFAEEFSMEHTLAFHPTDPQCFLSMIRAWDPDTDYDWTQLHIRCSKEMSDEIVSFYQEYWRNQHETYDYYVATGGDVLISYPNQAESEDLQYLNQYLNECQLRGLEELWASDFFN